MKTAISHQIQQAQRQTQKISARQIQALQILRLDREALREEAVLLLLPFPARSRMRILRPIQPHR